MEGLGDATAGELAIHRRICRLSYSRRYAEVSAVQAHIIKESLWCLGLEIAYVVKDAKRREVDPARTAIGVISAAQHLLASSVTVVLRMHKSIAAINDWISSYEGRTRDCKGCENKILPRVAPTNLQ